MPLDTITGVRDAITAVEEVAADFKDAAWWRGHSRAPWTLLPKVYRPPTGGRPHREQNLILHFQAQASTRRDNCPDRDDHAAWLFLAQHYGLATRLLDWTWSALTALFFVVWKSEHDAEPGALWALHSARLNAEQGLPPMLPVPESASVAHLFKAAFDGGTPTGQVIAVAPHEVDIRMMVQLSSFTIHDTDKPLEAIVADPSPFLRKYTIPPTAKPLIRDSLGLLAIESSNLFPDLEHLAGDLNSKP